MYSFWDSLSLFCRFCFFFYLIICLNFNDIIIFTILSECLCYNAKCTLFVMSCYARITYLLMLVFYKMNTMFLICIVLAHWNNSLQVNMSLHMDTLSYLRHWNNSLQVNMSLHMDTLSYLRHWNNSLQVNMSLHLDTLSYLTATNNVIFDSIGDRTHDLSHSRGLHLKSYNSIPIKTTINCSVFMAAIITWLIVTECLCQRWSWTCFIYGSTTALVCLQREK
jgi:hypothetical protein